MKKNLPRIFGFIVFIIALTTFSITRPYSVVAAECVSSPSRVWATTGPGSGQVTISWDGVTDASRYAVVYGTKSGSYVYGGDPIGEASSRQYTVNALQPGGHYYFRVIAKRGNCPGPWSAEAHAVAGGHQSALSSGNMMVGEPMSMMKAGLPAGALAKAGPVGKLNLWAKSGPNPGEVTLYWQHADSANNYHLMYGPQAGSYVYGALNIGNVTSFTVRHLAKGKMYHFALVPLLNDRPLYTTSSVGVSAYMNLPQPAVQPVNQVMELMPTVTPTPRYQGSTMNQGSMYEADDDEDGDEMDELSETEDEDELFDTDEREDNDQGYMMNQEDEFSDEDDDQMAQQYLVDPEQSRTGGTPYDPLFE